MEITEKERGMLEQERDKIRELTQKILELESDPKNSTEIKKLVIGIQSSIHRMASYSNLKNYKLDALTKMAETLLTKLLSNNPPKDIQEMIDGEIRNPSEELIRRMKKSKFKLEKLQGLPLNVSYPAWWGFVVYGIDEYCCYVNSIRFDFTKKGLKIILPKKIKLPDINLGININK